MGLNVRGSDSLYWKTGLDTGGLDRDTAKAKGILAGFARQITALDVFAAISVGAAYHAKKAIKEITLLAARYETLGVVMRTVGNNAGYSGEQMEGFAKSLEETGISILESRQSLLRMIQAQLDLTKASELARVAQDAAVIGNINSSEAFQRMVYGIQSGQVEILRTIGLNVNFENSYQRVAKATNRTALELGEAEKAQIRMNVVMEAGERIAGTYEAAMGTAGKQLLSLERHVENLKVLTGRLFTPVLAEAVEGITNGIIDLNAELVTNEEKVAEWGTNFRLGLISIEAEIMRLAMLIDKIGGTISTMAAMFAMIPSMIPHVPGTLVGALAEAGKEAAQDWIEFNRQLESRYTATEKALEALAQRYIELEASKTDAVKKRAKAEQDAAEEARLAAVKATAAGVPLTPVGGPIVFGPAAEAAFKRYMEDEKNRREWIKQQDAEYKEWVLSSNKDLLAARIASIETEMAQYTEEQNFKMGLIDELKLRREQFHEFEVDENRAALDQIMKDTRGWGKKSLEVYAQFLKEQAALYEGNEAMQEAILERYAETMQKVYDAEIRKIREVGDALSSLGDLIGQFDTDLGSSVQQVAAMANDVAGMVEGFATGNWLQAGTSGADLLTKFISYFDKSEERARQAQMKNQALARWISDQRTFINDMGNTVKAYTQAIETLTQLSKTGRDPILGVLSPDELLEVRRTLKSIEDDYRQMLTGTTADSIADAITAGFREGLDSATVFADTFEDLMQNAIINSFKARIVKDYLEKFYDAFAGYAEGGLDQGEIDKLRTIMLGGQITVPWGGPTITVKGIMESIGEEWAVLQDLLESAGIGLPGAAAVTPKGLAGAIAGVTEQTAGLLAGQFGAVRINIVEHLNVTKQMRDYTSVIMSTGLDNLRANQETAVNTRYLKRIDERLAVMSRDATVRAIGAGMLH